MIDARFNLFTRQAPSTVITDDRRCSRCSYNLKGLRTGDRCPECGTPIRLPTMRFDDVMSEAPMAYLRRMAWWSWGMLISATASSVLLVVATLPHRTAYATSACMFLAAGSAGVWAWGVRVVTSPREPGRPTTVNPAKEWRGWRAAARWTQVGWPAGMALAALSAGLVIAAAGGGATRGMYTPGLAIPAISIAMFITALVLMVAGFVGMIPLAIYLSLLADWAQDAGLGMRLRVAPFALAVGVPLLALTLWLSPLMLGSWIPVFVAPLLAIVGVGFLVCLGFFVVPMFQFATLCSWAVNNSTTASDRDRGLSARLVRRIEDARAKDEPTAPVQYHKPSRPQGMVVPRSGSGQTYGLAPEPGRGDTPGAADTRSYDDG